MNEEDKVSKYSSGVNIIIRIDQLWKNCHYYKRQGFYNKWNEELDSVWLELARDIEEKDYYDLDLYNSLIYDFDENKKVKEEGYKSKFEKFDRQLAQYMPFIDSGGRGFQGLTTLQQKNRDKQYRVLMEKQLFLARLENELGKGTSWEEEDEDF